MKRLGEDRTRFPPRTRVRCVEGPYEGYTGVVDGWPDSPWDDYVHVVWDRRPCDPVQDSGHILAGRLEVRR